MNTHNDLSIAILAGGLSTRMGRDKAALEVGGETLLARTARLALEISPHVCIVGRERDESWPRELRVVWTNDDARVQGPLAGLLGALNWNSQPRMILLPCDLPRLQIDALRWIERASSTCEARDGLATTRGGALEPMFSVYNREVEEHARKYLASGRRSLHALIESGEFERSECPEDVATQIFNCNTPEDWRHAQK